MNAIETLTKLIGLKINSLCISLSLFSLREKEKGRGN